MLRLQSGLLLSRLSAGRWRCVPSQLSYCTRQFEESPQAPLLSGRSVSRRLVHLALGRGEKDQNVIRRALSTTHAENDDMSLLTERILDGRATPLGTFSPDLTESTIEAIGYWCARRTLIIQSLTIAEKLLQRFTVERASGNISAKDKAWVIPELQEMLLHAWLDVDHRLGAERAGLLLHTMVRRYASRRDVKPTKDMFVAVMEKWLQVGGDPGVIEAAKFLLLFTDHPDLVESVESRNALSDWFHKLIPMLSEIDDEESDGAAQLLLKRMKELNTFGQNNLESVDSLLEAEINVGTPRGIDSVVDGRSEIEEVAFFSHALQKQFEEAVMAGDSGTAEKVESMFNRLVSTGEDKDAEFMVDVDTYLLMLDFYSRIKPEGVEAKAAKLFQKMIEMIESGRLNGPLPGKALKQVMELLFRSNDEDVGYLVRGIFDSLKRQWLSRETEFHPSAQSLSHMMSIRQPQDAARETKSGGLAEDLFLFWRDHKDAVDRSTLMKALALATEKLASKGQAEKADGIIDTAIRAGFEPDSSVFEGVLRGHAAAGHGLSAADSLDRWERLHGEGESAGMPPFSCYEQVLMSLSGRKGKSARAFQRMKKLFNHLCEQQECGNVCAPSSSMRELSEKLLASLARNGRPGDAEALLLCMEERMKSSRGKFVPSAKCFNIVLTEHKKDVTKVRSLFRRILEHRESGFSGLSPDAVTFGIYLNTLAMRGGIESVEEATDALELLIALSQTEESLEPDCRHFNHVLSLLRDVGDDEALTRACDLVDRMLDLGVRPETFNFVTVLQGHRRYAGGGPAASERAERLLDRMIAEVEGGNADVRLEAAAFNAVIGALGRSGRGDAAWRSLALLERMERLGVEPDAYTYNMLLDVAARAGRSGDEHVKLDALGVAVDAMVRLRANDSRLSPDEVTYQTLIKAYTNLVPRGTHRQKLLRQAFHMCCHDGLLSDDLLERFRRLMGSVEAQKLIKPDSSVPESWSRNLPKSS